MKMLVVRFSSIGDVVLTTPVVRCIAQQLPETEIHYITKKAFLPVLEGNPHIDKIIAIESSVSEKIAELQAENYDVIIDLHRNVRTLRLKRALGVKSYAFPKRNIEKFLLTNFKINRMPDVHVVDRYFEAVKAIGVKNDGLPCELFLAPADEVNLAEHNLQPKRFVAVAMGAQFATKQMPIHLMADILSGIELPIVLLGGPTDLERSDLLKQQLSSQQVVDFCGKITLRQSAFVVSQAKAILTGDTGLMHIASAFSIPIVSVWGNTVPAFGMYPYAPQDLSLYSIHEVNNLSCRPCSKIGYKECPKKHFNCMEMQDEKAIQADLLKRM
ncbi:MAG: glycosyl transferase [Candidatus Fluviicola riflensis]|nr:MAG: glycosyl transferase [Candidatus Fluviicola riflensis]OGS78206.1 MAG: glycosyl transferase [Candidatus Fluviicola riflensis]OGS85272.1 MAG: glycosyl transferase [Fluviicola sp. RIFCSPHIGHO2_01_FULL_43_53]OGS87314.1 MAG: glycosyl transferase [Fluviicola sp. RIFCSPHIGHO2_12_FULL_43_24]